MKGPIEHTFGRIGPSFCLAEAEKIVTELPFSERSNSSGKFYKTYKCWHFHKTSENPLIQEFVSQVNQNLEKLEEVYKKKFQLEFVILSEVTELNCPVSLWHKDGHFFDGQFHLSILGNARVEVEDDDGETLEILKEDGTLWYLNGSHYRHRLPPVKSRRLELCAPNNQLPLDVEIKKSAIKDLKLGLVDGENKTWTELRKKQANHVLEAIEKKTASNLKVGEFSVDPRD